MGSYFSFLKKKLLIVQKSFKTFYTPVQIVFLFNYFKLHREQSHGVVSSGTTFSL